MLQTKSLLTSDRKNKVKMAAMFVGERIAMLFYPPDSAGWLLPEAQSREFITLNCGCMATTSCWSLTRGAAPASGGEMTEQPLGY